MLNFPELVGSGGSLQSDNHLSWKHRFRTARLAPLNLDPFEELAFEQQR